jgi:hypothetical protein
LRVLQTTQKISLTRKIIKVEFYFFHFCPEKLGSGKKIPDAKKNLCILRILILPNNYGQFINVEESFHLCPNILGILEMSSCFKKNVDSLRKLFFAFIIYPQKMFLLLPTPFEVLSQMKVNMLGKTTLEALVNMKVYFNLLESRV